MNPLIKVYGTERHHKSQYYKHFFEALGLDYTFLDVQENTNYAEELRNLYDN